mgnify:FL=1
MCSIDEDRGTKKEVRMHFFFFCKYINLICQYYSSEIVPTGHEPAQAPHEMHCEPSITKTPPLSLIAPTGHEPAHEPQPIHESPITNAILVSSL